MSDQTNPNLGAGSSARLFAGVLVTELRCRITCDPPCPDCLFYENIASELERLEAELAEARKDTARLKEQNHQLECVIKKQRDANKNRKQDSILHQ
jgi:hypothetical protein